MVTKSGAWYTFEGEQLGQGKENSRKYLKDNPELADTVEHKIKVKLGIGVPRPVADLPAAEEVVEEIEPVAKAANDG